MDLELYSPVAELAVLTTDVGDGVAW
jgi:hypothetical protein